MKRLVIVGGAPGAGKSETLRSMRHALAGRVGEVAVLETDHFYMMIDPYWTARSPEVERYYEVSGWLTCKTAQGFLKAGFDLVVIGGNGLADHAHVREFAGHAVTDGASAHHVTLDPGFEVVVQRMASRVASKGNPLDEQLTPDALGAELSRVRGGYGPWTHVIDNSSLTPAETAVAILDAVEDGRAMPILE